MPAAERKRPFYLVLALFGALAFGTFGALDGWSTFRYYRGTFDPALGSAAARGIDNEQDRAAVVARSKDYLQTLDAARERAWPAAVAAILLGSSMFVFALRAIGGSAGARAILVQLVIAQAVANVADRWVLRDVYDAELRLNEAEQAAYLPAWAQAEDRARATSIVRAVYSLSLGVQTLGSVLIVVALTRRRVREFFDAAGHAVGGP